GALALMLAGVVLIVAAAVADIVPGVVVGLLAYAAGVGVIVRDVAGAALGKAPTSVPTWSLLAGLTWLLGLLLALTVGIAARLLDGTSGAAAWVALGEPLEWLTPYFAAGFVAQVLLG